MHDYPYRRKPRGAPTARGARKAPGLQENRKMRFEEAYQGWTRGAGCVMVFTCDAVGMSSES